MPKPYSFFAVELRPGEKLVFSAFGKNETATVADDTHIRFRGEITSLSPAALILAQEAGKKWTALSGPMYWKHPNGQTLFEYRESFLAKQTPEPTKLIDALRSAAKKKGVLEKTKDFLRSEDQLRKFAEYIEQGNDRDTFLTIPRIDSDIYENLRTILNDETIGDQKIVVKRGRAGGITLISLTSQRPPPPNPTEQKAVQEKAEALDSERLKLEKEYYPLVKAWAEQEGYAHCEITGGKLPGFKWENPDLIAIDYVVNEYARSVAFDITSFEVKLRVEPSAIWQAAHYKHFSLEVYVAFAQDEKTIREQDGGRVFDLAI
jgi:hypothetical protein